MAENEIEESLEDDSIDGYDTTSEDNSIDGDPSSEDDAGEKKKGISKPTLIKIAIGVAVLLLIGAGVGGYFFFTSEDEAAEPDATTETAEQDASMESEETKELDNIIEPDGPSETSKDDVDLMEEPKTEGMDPKDMQSDDEAVELLEIQEETTSLKEENLLLKQRISELEALRSNLKETMSKSEQVLEEEMATKLREDVPVPKIEIDPYIINQQYEPVEYQSRHQSNRVPTPKPKWGEFDRLNKE